MGRHIGVAAATAPQLAARLLQQAARSACRPQLVMMMTQHSALVAIADRHFLDAAVDFAHETAGGGRGLAAAGRGQLGQPRLHPFGAHFLRHTTGRGPTATHRVAKIAANADGGCDCNLDMKIGTVYMQESLFVPVPTSIYCFNAGCYCYRFLNFLLRYG